MSVKWYSEVGQTGLFNIGKATGLGEEKAVNSKPGAWGWKLHIKPTFYETAAPSEVWFGCCPISLTVQDTRDNHYRGHF